MIYANDAAGLRRAVAAGEREIRISGVIRLAQPVEIINPATRITGEGATVTARIPISPAWREYNGQIFVANIAPLLDIDALYKDGARLQMARYPNYTPGVLFGGFAADAVSNERAAKWHNPEGGHICALHDAEWGSNHYLITGKDASGELQYRWVGDNNRGSRMHNIKRMVENIFEELDAPGEWFYRRETGELFAIPEGDIAGEYEIVSNSRLFHITAPGARFEGIEFASTARTVFTGVYERPLRGDWGIVRDGAMLFENTQGAQITNCVFTDIGGNAVTFSAYNSNARVANCDFTHIGATGVLITGLQTCARDASHFDGDDHKTVILDFTPGPCANDYPRDIAVESCYFYDIGTVEKQTAAVCMSVSERVRVANCTVHHCSRAGINIHDGTFGGHIIENNDLFDCVTETADHGPINAWGRDRFWSVPQHDALGYYGKKKRPFALLDARAATVIRHNRVHATHAFGIDIDDGASNYDIYDNLCLGVGIKLRDGFDRRAHNNLLVGAGFELHMSFAQNNDLIYTNVVVFRKAYNEICINEGATTVRNNNLYWNPSGEVDCLPDDEYAGQTADPRFIDFARGNYALAPDSPAVKMGFVPFDISDAAFGRADAPKPPAYIYVDSPRNAQTVRYYDVLLSDIDGEGMRSAAGLPDFSGAFIAERDVLGLFCKLGLPIGVGDVIRGIGDASITCAADFKEAFERVPMGELTSVSIYRSQKPLKLDFIKSTDNFRSIADETEEDWRERIRRGEIGE